MDYLKNQIALQLKLNTKMDDCCLINVLMLVGQCDSVTRRTPASTIQVKRINGSKMIIYFINTRNNNPWLESISLAFWCTSALFWLPTIIFFSYTPTLRWSPFYSIFNHILQGNNLNIE